jgi:putative phage-type endonuclease
MACYLANMTITEKIEGLGLAKLIGNFTSGSPEWHAARAGIGGSDLAAIMGKSPYKSAYTLWAEKSNLIDQPEETIQMKLGTAFEPAIRNLFIDQNKDWLTVHETGTWQSNEHAWAKANPDGIIEWSTGELGILEIKHTAVYSDKIPDSWNLQVQWYLNILGLSRGIVCAVIGGRWTEFDVRRDDSLIEEMKTASRAFYECIESGLAPDFDGSTSTYETIRELSPGLEDGEMELGDLFVNLMAAKVIYEEADKNFNMHKAVALAYMNGVKYGLYQGEKVITLQARNGKPFITFK